jgi:hypothetical protein
VSGKLAAFVAALLLTLFLDVLAAQGIFGRISGTVMDSQQGAVAGAKVSILNQDTRLQRVVTTDTNGYYVASDLPVGVYSVSAEQTGFKTVTSTENDLVAGAHITVDLTLPIGEISQRVEVAAIAESVNTTSGELARTIDSNQVKAVALNGRH